MKTVFCLVALMFCMTRIDASVFKLDGSLAWNVTEPQCEFKLKGDLQNLSGTETGVIKLVLWATPAPYPSAGYNIGEYTLGQLSAGQQFTDFTVKTKANVPFINGTFYFTIAVVEYTVSGWRNVLLVPTGTKALSNGDFAGQAKWVFPIAPVLAPRASILTGDVINLSERATGESNQFPIGWRDKIALTAKGSTSMKFASNSREATVNYDYSVQTTKLKTKKVSYGRLILTYGNLDHPTFTDTVSLFFQGVNYGTYKSVVSGTLWTGSTLPATTTWGSFKFQ